MSYFNDFWLRDLSFIGFKIAYFETSLVWDGYLNINRVISLVNFHNTMKFQAYCNLKISKGVPSGSTAQGKKVFIAFSSKWWYRYAIVSQLVLNR